MKIWPRFSALFSKKRLDADMAEEMRLHLEQRTRENEAAGLTPEEARHAALRKFGGVEQVKEQARDGRSFVWLEHFVQDVRYGVRMLCRNPGFTLVVALTLALCIGLNTVVFTFYGAIAFKPPAVRAPAEVVRVVGTDAGKAGDAFAYPEVEDIRARARSFASVVASSTQAQLLLARPPGKNPDEAEVVSVRLVSDNYFAALGVVPKLGRSFGSSDATGTVLSYDYWQRRFHGDPAVLGQTLIVQDVPVTILGVAPEAFTGIGGTAAVPNFWLPLTLQPALLPTVDWLHDELARQWQILARLNPGVTIAQAGAELAVFGHAWPMANGQVPHWTALPATQFHADSGGYEVFTVIILILTVAVALILLTGCANVVNLLAARNATRERELAVRLALGAGRYRLIRQLCTESLLLGLLGGAGGLLFSMWACSAIRLWLAHQAQEIFHGTVNLFVDLAPDWRVLAYATGVSALTGIVVGIWPAVRATRANLETALRQDASGLGAAARGPWSRRNLLLTLQVAVSLMMLAGAGLLFRGARMRSWRIPVSRRSTSFCSVSTSVPWRRPPPRRRRCSTKRSSACGPCPKSPASPGPCMCRLSGIRSRCC